jgi:hypothetical protein
VIVPLTKYQCGQGSERQEYAGHLEYCLQHVSGPVCVYDIDSRVYKSNDCTSEVNNSSEGYARWLKAGVLLELRSTIATMSTGLRGLLIACLMGLSGSVKPLQLDFLHPERPTTAYSCLACSSASSTLVATLLCGTASILVIHHLDSCAVPPLARRSTICAVIVPFSTPRSPTRQLDVHLFLTRLSTAKTWLVVLCSLH